MGASKKNRSKRSKVIVGFEDEVVKKADARVILQQIADHAITEDMTSEHSIDNSSGMNRVKQKKRKRITNNSEINIDNVESEIVPESTTKKDRKRNEVEKKNSDSVIMQTELEHKTSRKIKKKKVNSYAPENEDIIEDVPLKKKKRKDLETSPSQDGNDVGADESVSEKKESIRAQKRRKHAELLNQKKMKAELNMQQNALNYLSKWKHSRSDWKFEKLKQIWLQQNLYDAAKIPKEFWNDTVEYFAGSKGAIRDTILKDSIKIIDREEQFGENDENENQVKLQRARDIIQYLQE